MAQILPTASICPICYAEIPASCEWRGSELIMSKTHCGHTWECVVERDPAFTDAYYTNRGHIWSNMQGCLVEITHRCNNKCLNCYHSEDRGLTDPSVPEVFAKVLATPHPAICLIGGEPTVRNDICDIVKGISALGRSVAMYTNGILMDSTDFVDKLLGAGLVGIGFSLHHPDYSSPKVLMRKRAALEVLARSQLIVEHVSFSLENEGQIPGILDEITRYRGYANSFRIRSGYQPTRQQWLVPDLYALVKAEADRRGESFVFFPGSENTRYQVGFLYAGIPVWLMSWPSDMTIDLSHAQGFPLAAFLPGSVQHFCRAVVTQEGWRKGWFNGRRVS